MPKALPFAPVYLNDLLGECVARGFGLRERGILFHLLWVQHLNDGTIPSDIRELKRLLGDEATADEIKAVLGAFFPLMATGRRSNPQHADAQTKARQVYDAKVRGGQIRAAQMWAGHRSPNSTPNSTPTSSPYSNQNQNQSQIENQNPTTGIPQEKKKDGVPSRLHWPEDPDDDSPPF